MFSHRAVPSAPAWTCRGGHGAGQPVQPVQPSSLPSPPSRNEPPPWRHDPPAAQREDQPQLESSGITSGWSEPIVEAASASGSKRSRRDPAAHRHRYRHATTGRRLPTSGLVSTATIRSPRCSGRAARPVAGTDLRTGRDDECAGHQRGVPACDGHAEAFSPPLIADCGTDAHVAGTARHRNAGAGADKPGTWGGPERCSTLGKP